MFKQFPQYNPTNTFIVDDSSSKIKSEHISCFIRVREFRVDNPALNYKMDEDLLHVKTILEKKLALLADDHAHDKDNHGAA